MRTSHGGSSKVRIATVLSLLMVVAAIGAEGRRRDQAYGGNEAVKQKVRRFQVLPGQRILLSGDSIARGYGFGNYTDPSPLRTIYGIAQILMKQNLAHPPEYLRLPGVWAGVNPDGTPKTVDTLAGEIQVYFRRGEIRTGDWMIYEAAGELDRVVRPGPWPNPKNVYQGYRKALRDMVLEAESAMDREHIRFMTMFDYNPKCSSCAWDAPLDDGLHTGNDAIRDEAAALGVECIDLNRIMDRAQEYIQSRGWGRLVGPDGIHPNVYGNFVMSLAILESLGADIAHWKLDQLERHYRHPEAGGDVKAVWGFVKDPTDPERAAILEDLRRIVLQETTRSTGDDGRSTESKGEREKFFPTAHTFRRLLRHGRLLDHPARQPEGTTKPASYELGKLFQLDRDTALLVASLREQGGHDFEIGNDGFVFRDLSEIVPERAIPINRPEIGYKTRSGQNSVLSKYIAGGAFVPLGARLENGSPHPAAGTGFLLSSVITFLPDRSEITPAPDMEQFLEFYQVRWDGKSLKVVRDRLPPDYRNCFNPAFNCLPNDSGFLCPLESDAGIKVVRFEHTGDRWRPIAAGKPFSALKEQGRALAGSSQGEIEPSIVRQDDGYLVYTRGSDRRGRVYRSQEGLNYYLAFDHWNHTVPQVLNQGLDGGIYLMTNTGPGWLRNPLLAFALRGVSFVTPVIVHDEKQIGDDSGRQSGKEVPFCDHGIGTNVLLDGRWRHLILYRVLDLRETNGEGAPPRPQTGLYLAEFEYGSVTHPPFRF